MHPKISSAKSQNQDYQKYSNVEKTVQPKDRWFGDLRVMQDVEVVIVSIPNVLSNRDVLKAACLSAVL